MRTSPSSKSRRSFVLDLLPDRVERALSGGDGHPHPSRSTTICVSVSSEARSGCAVEGGAGIGRVPERELARLVERAGGSHALERIGDVLAGERSRDGLVPPRGEDERERRRAVAEVDSRRPSRSCRSRRSSRGCRPRSGRRRRARGRSRRARAVRAAAEEAGCLEELPGLQRAAREVLLDRGLGPEGLASLQRLAAREGERGVGEDGHRLRVAGRRELRERPREEIVAGRPARSPRRARPRPSAGRGADRPRRAGRRGRASPCGRARPRHRRRPRARRSAPPAGVERKTSSGRSRLPPAASVSAPDLAEAARVRGDRVLEPVLEQVEVAVEPGSLPDGRERVHRLVPTCSATIPPPISFQPTLVEAGAAECGGQIRRARGSAARSPGGRCTPAPPGRTLPASGHEAVEPEPEERAQHAAGTGDLEAREAAARPQHARELARARPRGPGRCECRSRR